MVHVRPWISTCLILILSSQHHHKTLSAFVTSKIKNDRWLVLPKNIHISSFSASRKSTTTQLPFSPVIEIEPNLLSSSNQNNPNTISCLNEKGNFQPENESYYVLGIAEGNDIPPIAELTVQTFGADMVLLSQDLNEFEKALINPVVGLWYSYTSVFAYTELLFGLRSRLSSQFTNRLDGIVNPSTLLMDHGNNLTKQEMYDIAAKSSLVLCLARTTTTTKIDCIATIEVRLQPSDAKIPFSQPWMDVIERKLVDYFKIQPQHIDTTKPSLPFKLQPYLCNLCVSKQYRKQNIGQTLVGIIEHIAFTKWGFEKLYLHVDIENKPALKLYEKLGYKDAGWRWNPFWVGGAGDIGYLVKNKDL